jgi:acetyltransferase-like isoleucine patch superfamily enzyme
MSNSFGLFFIWLRRKVANAIAVSRVSEALEALTVKNPTCRILSAMLDNVELGKYVSIGHGAILDGVTVSDFSYVAANSIIRNAAIGKFCSISSNVQIGLAPHPSRIFVSTYPAFYSSENLSCPVSFRKDSAFNDSVPRSVLSHDIWIGANAIIPGGINIGTGAIVAAGAVVVKDVPPYAIVGGNPAHVLRYRFSAEQIELLLRSEWWDWPLDTLRARVSEFCDITKFLDGSNPWAP